MSPSPWLLLLALAGCPAGPTDDPGGDDSSSTGDTAPPVEEGTGTLACSVGGTTVPPSVGAFWARVPAAPDLYVLGPAGLVSTHAWDDSSFEDNTVSVTVVLTDLPDGCEAWAAWWTAFGAQIEEFWFGDRMAAAGALEEAEAALLPADFWVVGLAFSTDGFHTLPGDYAISHDAMVEVHHQREHTPWEAAAQGQVLDNADLWVARDGTLSITAGEEGGLLSGSANFSLQGASQGSAAFEATHCAALESALEGLPFFG